MNNLHEKLGALLDKHYGTRDMLRIVVPLSVVFFLIQYTDFMS